MIIIFFFSCNCFASKADGLGARLFNVTSSFGWLPGWFLFCCLETTGSPR